MVTTIIIFILVLGLLVLVHEFGHFYVAKKSGMVVYEFGFGFPPRLFGIQKIEGKWKVVWGPGTAHRTSDSGTGQVSASSESTIYSINWIPLGGFVRIMGENNEQQQDPKSFVNKPFWPRFFTLVAGVAMNFLLAAVIFAVGFGMGLPAAFENSTDVPKGAKFSNAKPGIVEVVPGQPAEIAGLKAGDSLVALDGNNFTSAEEYRNYIQTNSGKEFNFTVQRGGENFEIKVQSIKDPGPNQGPTGIALATLGELSYPWYMAPVEGFKTASAQTINIVMGLYDLITSKIGLGSLGGPVKIAQLTGQVADMGIVYLLQFTAFLSLNLAVLNIMPFPALDGGRVLFLIVEKIRGKKNNQKLEQWANAAGFALLLLLMLLVTIKDVRGF